MVVITERDGRLEAPKRRCRPKRICTYAVDPPRNGSGVQNAISAGVADDADPGQLVGRFSIRIPAVAECPAQREPRCRACRRKALLGCGAEVTFFNRADSRRPGRVHGPGQPCRRGIGWACPAGLRAPGRRGREPGDALSRAAGTGPAARTTFPCAGGPLPGWPRVPAPAIIAGCGVPVRAGPLSYHRAGRPGAARGTRAMLSGLGDESLAVTGTAGVEPAGRAVAC